MFGLLGASCSGRRQTLSESRQTLSVGVWRRDSEVGSKYGNTSGTHMETIYPVTEMLHGEAREGRTVVFRIQSDENKHLLPRNSRLFVRYKIGYGEVS